MQFRRYLVYLITLVVLACSHALAIDPYTVEGLDGEDWVAISNGSADPVQPISDFGTWPNGSSVTKQFRITNQDLVEPLEVTSIDFAESYAFEPSIFRIEISPGASIMFTIQFNAGTIRETTPVALRTNRTGTFETFVFTITGEGLVQILHVDASATGADDGSSWVNAFTKLQDALSIAISGDQVLVAAGIYFPDEGSGQTSDDRESTFTIPDGLVLTGSYPVGGGAPDVNLHTTILSGDLQQDDLDIDGNGIAEITGHYRGRNAYTVVTIVEEAILHGFTITAGRADGSFNDPTEGGGIRAAASSPQSRVDLSLNHCHLIGCFAKSGSAIYLNTGELELNHCRFSGNRTQTVVSLWGGTCIASGDVRSVIVRDCQFVANEAQVERNIGSSGAELFVRSSDSRAQCLISDTVVRDYDDDTEKHGLFRFENLKLVRLERCEFFNNRCGEMLRFINCRGSALENSRLSGNVAANSLCLLSHNELSILNTTIASNSTPWGVSKFGFSDSGTVLILNSLMDEPIGSSGGEPDLEVVRSHSMVAGFGADGNGNLNPDIDPRFVSPISSASAPTASGDYRLLADSPLIDMGFNGDNPAGLDLDNRHRIADADGDGEALIDIGAYELPGVTSVRITEVSIDSNGEFQLEFSLDNPATVGIQNSPDLSSGSWNLLETHSLPSGSNVLAVSIVDREFFRLLVMDPEE